MQSANAQVHTPEKRTHNREYVVVSHPSTTFRSSILLVGSSGAGGGASSGGLLADGGGAGARAVAAGKPAESLAAHGRDVWTQRTYSSEPRGNTPAGDERTYGGDPAGRQSPARGREAALHLARGCQCPVCGGRRWEERDLAWRLLAWKSL